VDDKDFAGHRLDDYEIKKLYYFTQPGFHQSTDSSCQDKAEFDVADFEGLYGAVSH
jgi:hypothetical protein